MDIYIPNDQTRQVKYLTDLSTSVLKQGVDEKVLLGGDFYCALNDIDERGRRSFESNSVVIKEINELTNDLVDMWRQKHPGTRAFTLSNASLKIQLIQTRPASFLSSRNMQHLITSCQIVPTTFTNHSELRLCIHLKQKETKRRPGFLEHLITPCLPTKNI